jgi:hypothetical protein
MKIIALNGRLKSGKDTACETIQQVGSGNVRREGFADRMKVSGVLALGYKPTSIQEALVIANRLKDTGQVVSRFVNGEPTFGKRPDGTLGYNAQMQQTAIDGRTFWQLYGTEAHREVFGTDFWVDALLPDAPRSYILNTDLDKAQQEAIQRALAERFPGVDTLVITDCRFESEAQRALDLGGEVWLIDADERLGPLPPDAHASEQGLPAHLITRTIYNNGTLEAFRQATLAAMKDAAL